MHAQGVSNGKIAYRLHCNVELVVQVLAEAREGGNRASSEEVLLQPSQLAPYRHDDRDNPTTGPGAQPDMD